jgi:hypothetical protein
MMGYEIEELRPPHLARNARLLGALAHLVVHLAAHHLYVPLGGNRDGRGRRSAT